MAKLMILTEMSRPEFSDSEPDRLRAHFHGVSLSDPRACKPVQMCLDKDGTSSTQERLFETNCRTAVKLSGIDAWQRLIGGGG